MFAILQSLFALLAALLAVCAVARALRLDFPPAPARDLWKRLGGAGRVLASCAVALLALYAVSKEPPLRSSPPFHAVISP